MKRSILLSILFALCSTIFVNAASDIDLAKSPTPPPGPNSPILLLPVSATIDATELAVYFVSSVGDATITVYDESNNVIYQAVLDTNITMSVSIPSINWTPGDYSLSIIYGTTELTGNFVME